MRRKPHVVMNHESDARPVARWPDDVRLEVALETV